MFDEHLFFDHLFDFLAFLTCMNFFMLFEVTFMAKHKSAFITFIPIFA